MTAKFLLAVLPGGLLIAAALCLLRCRHDHEILDRDDMGTPILRCYRCHRARPHLLAGAKAAYHRVQEGGPVRLGAMTGIERMAVEDAAIQAEVDAMLARMDRSAKVASIARNVRAKFGGGW